MDCLHVVENSVAHVYPSPRTCQSKLSQTAGCPAASVAEIYPRAPLAIMGEMSEVAVRTMPRRGRLWVVVLLALGAIALGYALVNISTQKANNDVVHIAGI